MKHLTLLIILIIVSLIPAFGQNIIDPPKLLIDFNNTNIYDRNFFDNHFLLGWNWGVPGRVLDEALNINYYHGINPDDSDYCHAPQVIYTMKELLHLRGGHVPFNAYAVYYEPVINVDK
jgi:hypothetical protein